LRDFAIGKTRSETPGDVLFSFGKQHSAFGIHQPRCRCFVQGFEQVLKLDTTDPQLAFVYSINTAGKHGEGVGATKHSSRPSAKSLHHQLTLSGIDQHDYSSLRKCRPQLGQYSKASA
jgi:hypothetical protein